MTLNSNIGFTKNPFSKKSSEQELEFLDEIFYEPNYYNTLLNDLSNGDSRFIIGQRGHGKSSIINKLQEDLEKTKNLTVKIDRFDEIPISNNENALILLIIKSLTTKLSIFLNKNPKCVNKLDKIKKEKLALFIRLFFETLSKTEYDNIYDNVHKVKTTNNIRNFFNRFLLRSTNQVTSTLISIGSTFIRESLGIENVNVQSAYKNYFGEIDLIEFEKIDIKEKKFTRIQLKSILDELLDIIKTVGFKNTVILFDKIDEFQELQQDITKISDFTREILTDTELLLNDKFAIGFSLWSELRIELAKVVRFDKFESIDIRWKDSDLEPLINKRIKYFSNNKLNLDRLIENSNDKEELIRISHNSPRDLISALGVIYNEQSNNNQGVSLFEAKYISKGLINFSSNFNYDSIYPSKSSKNKDIKAMINRILKTRLTRFHIKHLNDAFNQRTAKSEGQINLMIQYKLIREDEVLGDNKIKYYDVIDPKIDYLVRRGVMKIE
ncbi:hypothetical protein ES677_05310 [Bizionia gelidisalsuginis]|uniref:ATP-binding protein n=1 Tax=Bizionia gelidisalsuginis TaxID=291188 RepID=A0ABY3MBZ4_9FLAO|nr:hypothetical protein [Bizionia gelidisalsuginis]TYC14799.1 hypothetical protein ES677_05310 [Bizionia gelidisalsuginis]